MGSLVSRIGNVSAGVATVLLPIALYNGVNSSANSNAREMDKIYGNNGVSIESKVHLAPSTGYKPLVDDGLSDWKKKEIQSNDGLEKSVEEVSEDNENYSRPPLVRSKGLIVLDPGHGNSNRRNGLYDPGAVSNGYNESKIVLSQAKKIKNLLEEKGYKVVLTRKNGTTSTPLKSRLPKAKNLNADLLVSLHCNASDYSSANGIETFYEGNARELAETVNNSLVNYVKHNGRLDVRNRGVKNRKLAILDRSLPSILVETGFITNSKDRKYLTDEILDVEHGIAEGIHKYMESRK